MRFHDRFLRRYLEIAPAALAIERSVECALLAKQDFERPILDLGCGDGIFAKTLFGESIDVGVDNDPAEIEKARRLDVYKELLVVPGNDIPKEDGSFRTIFSNSVLEHIPDLVPVLGEAYRLLTPGGRFFVTVPTDRFEQHAVLARLLEGLGLRALNRRYRAFYNRFWKHYNVHTPEGWAPVFQDVGFRVVETRLYNPKALCTLTDCLVPLAFPAFLSKKILNRWIAFPALRCRYVWLVHALFNPLVERFKDGDDGGLVFFALTKDR